MGKILVSAVTAILALLMGFQFSGASFMDYGLDYWYEERMEMEAKKNAPVFTKPVVDITFGDNFFELGEETTNIEYDGNMFDECYNYGKYTYEEYSKFTMTLRKTSIVGGEVMDFLDEYFVGRDAYMELRAVTINGEDQPYKFLYVRLYYPDEYFADGSYSDLYDMEQELFLTTCNDALLANGIHTVMFSMYDSSEMKVTSICTEEDGQFWTDAKE